MKNLKFWKEQNNMQDIKIYKFDTNNSYIDYSTISIFDGKMINNSNKTKGHPDLIIRSDYLNLLKRPALLDLW
jgi:hypothetical protein